MQFAVTILMLAGVVSFTGACCHDGKYLEKHEERECRKHAWKDYLRAKCHCKYSTPHYERKYHVGKYDDKQCKGKEHPPAPLVFVLPSPEAPLKPQPPTYLQYAPPPVYTAPAADRPLLPAPAQVCSERKHHEHLPHIVPNYYSGYPYKSQLYTSKKHCGCS